MKRFLKITTTYILILAMATSGMAFGAETTEDAKSSETSTEEAVQQKEQTQKPAVKISLDSCTVVLDKYFVKADGTDQTPEVTMVYKQYTIGNHTKTIEPKGYSVAYYLYKYENTTSKEISDDIEKVEACIKPGEYKVVVTAIEDGGYKGSCEALFTIAGNPQIITVDKTSYKKTLKSEDFQLNPKTTGDGDGFTFSSSKETVATVNAEGVVHITGCGETTITIITRGDVLSQPSTRNITVTVLPDKVVWKKTDAVTRTYGGTKAIVNYNEVKDATGYQIMYSTSKSFKNSASKTKKTKKLQTTLKGLKPGKTYYVKVRAVYQFTDSRGNTNVLYGNWSSVKTLKK